jgi:hypothetical protein
MSLPAVNWRYVGNAPFAVASVAAALDALFTLGTAILYADGSVRTPGSGSAGTWLRYQNTGVTESLRCNPATNTLAQQIILGGYAAASVPSPLPTMASPDTSAADVVMISLNKNSGAFATWNAALPFTSGQFFGYWRAWATSNGIGSVDLYECTEGVWIVWRNSTGASTFHAFAGAGIDPESPNTTLDAESDGKLYGVWTTGATNATTTSGFSTVAASTARAPWNHSATANTGNHAAIFTPGAGTLITVCPSIVMSGTLHPPSTTSFKTRSGRFARAAAFIVGANVSSPNDPIFGSVRGVAYSGNAALGQRLVDGATTVGYFVGATATASDQSYLLVY